MEIVLIQILILELHRSDDFLREYSLDEIPQLFNVLSGSMSLVGPRPIYNSIAQKLDKNQKKVLVKPGITGLAQIKGRTNLT